MIGLGDYELTGKSEEEVWQGMRTRNPQLEIREHYALYRGQTLLKWRDLPIDRLMIVPTIIPTLERELETDMTAHMRSRVIRRDGPMMPAVWQLFSWNHQPVSQVFDVQSHKRSLCPKLSDVFIRPRETHVIEPLARTTGRQSCRLVYLQS
jgi:hypothetical protein